MYSGIASNDITHDGILSRRPGTHCCLTSVSTQTASAICMFRAKSLYCSMNEFSTFQDHARHIGERVMTQRRLGLGRVLESKWRGKDWSMPVPSYRMILRARCCCSYGRGLGLGDDRHCHNFTRCVRSGITLTTLASGVPAGRSRLPQPLTAAS